MKISVIPGREVSHEHEIAWREIQRREPSLCSPYLCPEFTTAVAAVKDDVHIAVLEDGNRIAGFFPFERRRMGIGKPVGGPLSDCQGLVGGSELECDAERLLVACNLVAWDFDHLLESQTWFRPHHVRLSESPIIDLSIGYAAYRDLIRQRGSQQIIHVERLTRKFQREVGPLHFSASVADREALSVLLAWKSAQFRRSGAGDPFARSWIVELLERLHATQTRTLSGMLSVLYGPSGIISAHFGMRAGRVLHWWFPSYDPAFSRYSPGLMLLVMMIQRAATLGIDTIDLGKGDERYKRCLRNGAIAIAEGSVERRSVILSLRRLRRRAEVTSRALLGAWPMRIPSRMLRKYDQWRRYR